MPPICASRPTVCEKIRRFSLHVISSMSLPFQILLSFSVQICPNNSEKSKCAKSSHLGLVLWFKLFMECETPFVEIRDSQFAKIL